MLIWLICVAVLVFLDQLSKWLAVILLEGQPSFYLIPGVLRFTYVENRGAAFGMLADNRWVFLVLSTLTIVCLLGFMIYSKPQSRLERAGLALVLAGGIGNMIDRVLLGYVIDFIDFCAFPKLWNWVFNVADSCICIGVGLLIIYIIKLSVSEYKAEKNRREGNESTSDTDCGNAGERTSCHAPEPTNDNGGESTGKDQEK
ncbi:MAG: signal peptidase II [Eubacteriales bacterium]|nr:signal peptidase II [Eubacteriales bacterium]MDY5861320.1 signal peptidase II [Eubacteriales bacterium]